MLWKNTDTSANSPAYVANQLGVSLDSGNTANIFGNVMTNIFKTNVAVGVFGWDTNKMAAAQGYANVGMPAHAGWQLRTVGTGLRAGRVQIETLVAMSSITPTANTNNTVAPEFYLGITSQPQSNTWNRGNGVNLVVGANTLPAGQTITYYWQQDGGNASQTWANVQNSGTFASANGNTTSTLSIANNFLVNANNFRVILSVAGANNVTSQNAQVIWS